MWNDKLEWRRLHVALEICEISEGGRAMTSIALVIIFADIIGYALEVMKDEQD